MAMHAEAIVTCGLKSNCVQNHILTLFHCLSSFVEFIQLNLVNLECYVILLDIS
jgi:hypothetical protein